MSKPKLGYLLFDLPSNHEIENSLATECDTIQSIIHNRGQRARVKRIRVASKERFLTYPTYRYGVQFVHLACHGGKHGVGMLGESVSWAAVAEQISKHLHPLSGNAQRVICFSCCHSYAGYKATQSTLKQYFTGAYHFAEEKVPFSTAITTWTMFYLKKKLANPHEGIAKAINTFMVKRFCNFEIIKPVCAVHPG